MDLRNNTIKMRELFSNREAKATLMRAFPEFANPFMMNMAGGMTLAAVIKLAGNKVPRAKIESVIAELERL